MLDEIHPTKHDKHSYTQGEICGHNIVIAILPKAGASSVATVVTELLNDFPSIRFFLLIGIGGGVSCQKGIYGIRLGDVVVSKPAGSFDGAVEYNLGAFPTDPGLERKRLLGKHSLLLHSIVDNLTAHHLMKGSEISQHISAMLDKYPGMEKEYCYPGIDMDELFEVGYSHSGGPDCSNCDSRRVVKRDVRHSHAPTIHYGIFGVANAVAKDFWIQEELRQTLNLMRVEVEATGSLDTFPCLVIRGICDYADTHKNRKWQPYAAATAAAYMKELLSVTSHQEVVRASLASEIIQNTKHNRGLNLIDAPDLGGSNFTGRSAELERMETILLSKIDNQDRKILVLGGVQGIGKTQLAIRYAQKYGSYYSSVFWLHAASEISLKGSLRILARRILPVDRANGLEDDRLWLYVSNWLSELDNRRWLIIFDNYDDPDLYNIENFYPSASQGSIIITSRSPGRIKGEQLLVKTMRKLEDGLYILATRSGRDGVESDVGANQLVKQLDGLPLSLATAGAFLKKTELSFMKYVELYNSKWDIASSCLRPLPHNINRVLYTTWSISFTQMKQENAYAALMLEQLLYFDNQNVWFELLRAGISESTPLWFNEIAEDSELFEGVMNVLIDYSFIEAWRHTNAYGIHVGIHDWLHHSLGAEPDEQSYAVAFSCIAGSIHLESTDTSTVLEDRRLALHALWLGHQRFRSILSSPSFLAGHLDGMLAVATLLLKQNHYKMAEFFYEQLLFGREQVLGPDQAGTLDIAHDIGHLYRKQGKLAEAERMLLRAKTGSENTVGADHVSTLTTVNSLGLVYRDQGQLKLAEEMYLRALDGWKKTIGLKDKQALDTIHNLSQLYRDQGKLKDSEQMYLRALAGYRKILPPNHVAILNAMNNLANLYDDLGKVKKAEAMYLSALARSEKELEANHPLILDITNNLGLLYGLEGKSAQAEEFLLRSLSGSEKMLGPNHISTADTLNNLGQLYRNWGKLDEAEELFLRALGVYQRVLKADHSSILIVTKNLGCLYEDRCRFADAERIFLQLLAGFTNTLGADHDSTLDTAERLGRLRTDQGKLFGAEQNYLQALAGRVRVLGSQHKTALRALDKLEALYKEQEKLQESERTYLLELAGSSESLRIDDAWSLETVDYFEDLRIKQDKLGELELIYLRALEGRKNILGLNSTLTISIANSLGVLYHHQHNNEWAERMFLYVLSRKQQLFGADCPSTVQAGNNLGLLYKSQRRPIKAELIFSSILAQRHNSLGAADLLTLDVANNLGLLYHEFGKLDIAERIYSCVLIGRWKALGVDHKQTVEAASNLGSLLHDQGQLDQAERVFTCILTGNKLRPGARDFPICTISNLAMLYLDRNRLDEAERLFRLAHEDCQVHGIGKTEITEGLYHVLVQRTLLEAEPNFMPARELLDEIFSFSREVADVCPSVVGRLGRVLLRIGDVENARIAFQRQLTWQDGVMIFFNTICDSCERLLSHEMKRSVCMQCVDVDLCAECLASVRSGVSKFKTCKEHVFTLVESVEFPPAVPGVHFEQDTLSSWLAQLQQKHATGSQQRPETNEFRD